MPCQQKLTATFENLRRVHILGICGTLMAPFAAYLKRRGVAVTGSDQNIYPPMSDVLKDAGVEVFDGYRGENLNKLPERPDLVIIGNVITAANPEAQAAIASGCPYFSLPEALENLVLPKTRNLVVAGTHGKTTTSSLLAHLLVYCGKDPSYFIGGVSLDLPNSFHIAEIQTGSYFILEGDEYDTAFWDKVPKFNHYLPDDVILTSIEYDHADIYRDIHAVIRAFEGLMSRLRPGGSVIACGDYENVRNVTKQAKVACEFYGRDPRHSRFVPAHIRSEDEYFRFDIQENGQKVEELSISIPGEHNILNALAVWMTARKLKIAPEVVRTALKTFRGVKRRQEVRAEIGGTVIIDDFAHHPTAVRETLKALKMRFPGRRMVAVFEPRSATSRRKIFQSEYANAFNEADAVFLALPYDQSKIDPKEQFSSEQLVDDLKKNGKRAFLMQSVDDGVNAVAHDCMGSEVVAVLSNGGFGGFISKLIRVLKGES